MFYGKKWWCNRYSGTFNSTFYLIREGAGGLKIFPNHRTSYLYGPLGKKRTKNKEISLNSYYLTLINILQRLVWLVFYFIGCFFGDVVGDVKYIFSYDILYALSYVVLDSSDDFRLKSVSLSLLRFSKISKRAVDFFNSIRKMWNE